MFWLVLCDTQFRVGTIVLGPVVRQRIMACDGGERERGEGKVEMGEWEEKRKIRGRRKKKGEGEGGGRDGGIRLGNKLCLPSSSPVTYLSKQSPTPNTSFTMLILD